MSASRSPPSSFSRYNPGIPLNLLHTIEYAQNARCQVGHARIRFGVLESNLANRVFHVVPALSQNFRLPVLIKTLYMRTRLLPGNWREENVDAARSRIRSNLLF